MRNNKILLVDDEEAILKGLCYDFEEESYDIAMASSGSVPCKGK